MKRSVMVCSILFAVLALALPSRGAATDPPEGGKPDGAKNRSGSDYQPPGVEERDRQEKTKPAQSPGREGMAESTTARIPVYRPPLRGTPGGRVGGGTRGAGDETSLLSVLAPDHTGLTVREQPSLYWYLSGPTRYPVELTVTEENAVSPLLETRVRTPVQLGVNRIRLADYGIALSMGVTYKWFVSIVPDPDRRSKDVVAGGMILRVAPENLVAGPAGTDKSLSVEQYAESGLWYDAVQAISERIEASPGDATLRRQRASLMDQVGLPEIAEYDRKQLDATAGQ